ncbi:type IV secretory system conjugative DNA transfer family protein [Bradyrhizobium sp. RP6]|uniref:type IV secretory system conjugative DNA transfer family protein n=1 Tax=Bradyrhizobium sp. RP6 TaxID=2489596 RepID=UPI000F51FBD7|nr:type IV secretory system conjugative DNA transfer family protein [Bradyrhizobium sp. RP6]RQH06880.1 trag family protein [Bradyrhizobium sp. RP6]
MRTPASLAIAAILVLAAALVGYPIAASVTHGVNVDVWPAPVIRPHTWFEAILESYGWDNIKAYLDMISGTSVAFAGGGSWQAVAIFVPPTLVLLLLPASPPVTRDPRGTFGDARWAFPREKSEMREGIELGIDPDSGKPVRVRFEGNFLTIAPPRAGKTSGLAIPNLLAPTRNAWTGPAVVIDPKGQVFKTVAERRRALGRRVVCLDPMNLVGGIDTWCPMQTVHPNDVLHAQRIARAILPATTSAESVYFQNRATDLIVTAQRIAIAAGNPTPRRVAELIGDPEALAKRIDSLSSDTITDRVRSLLAMEARTRDPVISTAMQAFQWCDDPRMQQLTNGSTVDFEDLCRDQLDLFLTLPTESLETLAPFVRWFLTDLFATIRRTPPIERAIIFVDEARALGRYSELVVASGELPGHQASLWTFWQDRSQIQAIYGEQDAATLLRTAEFVTISDPAAVDPDECDFWSRALGDFSLLQETKSIDTGGGQKRTSTTTVPMAARLMSSEELARLPASELIVFPKSPRYAKRPLRLLKTRHDDPRLSVK